MGRGLQTLPACFLQLGQPLLQFLPGDGLVQMQKIYLEVVIRLTFSFAGKNDRVSVPREGGISLRASVVGQPGRLGTIRIHHTDLGSIDRSIPLHPVLDGETVVLPPVEGCILSTTWHRDINAEYDKRRQTSQPPAQIFGNVPAGLFGEDKPPVHEFADDGLFVDEFLFDSE